MTARQRRMAYAACSAELVLTAAFVWTWGGWIIRTTYVWLDRLLAAGMLTR